jgi:hypothetical protein
MVIMQLNRKKLMFAHQNEPLSTIIVKPYTDFIAVLIGRSVLNAWIQSPFYRFSGVNE